MALEGSNGDLSQTLVDIFAVKNRGDKVSRFSMNVKSTHFTLVDATTRNQRCIVARLTQTTKWLGTLLWVNKLPKILLQNPDVYYVLISKYMDPPKIGLIGTNHGQCGAKTFFASSLYETMPDHATKLRMSGVLSQHQRLGSSGGLHLRTW